MKTTFTTRPKTDLQEFMSIIRCNDKRILKLSPLKNQEEVQRQINLHKIYHSEKVARSFKEKRFLHKKKKQFKKEFGIGYKPKLLVSTKLV